MADSRHNIDYIIKARDEASAKFKNVKSSYTDMIKSTFGESSTFGQNMKMLAGAGALAGLQMAGRMMADTTQRLAELRREYIAGQVDQKKLVDEMMGSLPVLGNFWQTGRNLRELFGLNDGIREIERVNDLLKQSAIIYDELAAARKRGDVQADNWARGSMDIAADAMLSEMKAMGQIRDAELGAITAKYARANRQVTQILDEVKAEEQRLGAMIYKAKPGEKSLADQIDSATAKVQERDEALRFQRAYNRGRAGGGQPRTEARLQGELDIAISELAILKEREAAINADRRRNLMRGTAAAERDSANKLAERVERDNLAATEIYDALSKSFDRMDMKEKAGRAVDDILAGMVGAAKADMESRVRSELDLFFDPVERAKSGGARPERGHGGTIFGTDSMFGMGLAAASAEGMIIKSGAATARNTEKMAKGIDALVKAAANRNPIVV